MTERYQRPLRVQHGDDDVFMFMHIPKTGGLSLIAYLDAQFPQDRIFPLHSKTPARKTPVDDFTPSQLANYRFIRGHHRFGPYDNGFYAHVARNPIMLTFLREPIARTVSAYRHQLREKKIPENITLEQYLTTPEYQKFIVNHQSLMVIGKVKGNTGEEETEQLPEDVLLQLAKENLERMAFFGLTERFKESMQLLAHTFDWPMPHDIPMLNTAPEPFDFSKLKPETLELIKAKNPIDLELYKFAVPLFEKRYQQMIEEMLDENYRLRHPNGTEPQTLVATVLPTEQVRLRVRIVRMVKRNLFPRGTQREKLYLQMRDQILKRQSEKAHEAQKAEKTS